MNVNLNEIFEKQAEWQKSRKTVSWGDKIRQSLAARDSLGAFSYRPVANDKRSWSLREER